MAITIKVNEENSVKIEGNKIFVHYILDLLEDLFRRAEAIGRVTSEPFDTDVFLKEVEVAKYAASQNQSYKGKFVSFESDDLPDAEMAVGNASTN